MSGARATRRPDAGCLDSEGTSVTDTSRVAWASAIGAVLGGMWGYLYLTESGRRFRLQIEPRIDDFLNEVHRMQGTVHKAREAAGDSWSSLQEIANDVTRRDEARQSH